MRKVCPRCAERVKAEAVICRFCGYEFPATSESTEPSQKKAPIFVGLVLVAALLGAGAAYLAFRDMGNAGVSEAPRQKTIQSQPVAESTVGPLPDLILPGTSLEWEADKNPDVKVNRIGPFTITITKKTDGDLVAPIVEVSDGNASQRLEGSMGSPASVHTISSVINRAGTEPVVMLQSFTGGAHCCNQIQLAGHSHGHLITVDLGAWDGEAIDIPHDISGDGVADFVFSDDRFLYAFGAYAMSYAPPIIYNVVDGKKIDVSRRAAFRDLFQKSMAESGRVCVLDSDGSSRNAACPAYVASAARIGKLQDAWTAMVKAYDATSDWNLPTACMVDDTNGCPSGQEIRFKSYPEALLFFLKKNGYVAQSWVPKEQRGTDPAADDDEPTDFTI